MVGRGFHARQAYGQIFDPPGCPGVRCACGLRWHTGATCDVIPTKAAYMACLSQSRHCVREQGAFEADPALIEATRPAAVAVPNDTGFWDMVNAQQQFQLQSRQNFWDMVGAMRP
jgi:hypothetical protein